MLVDNSFYDPLAMDTCSLFEQCKPASFDMKTEWLSMDDKRGLSTPVGDNTSITSTTLDAISEILLASDALDNPQQANYTPGKTVSMTLAKLYSYLSIILPSISRDLSFYNSMVPFCRDD